MSFKNNMRHKEKDILKQNHILEEFRLLDYIVFLPAAFASFLANTSRPLSSAISQSVILLKLW